MHKEKQENPTRDDISNLRHGFIPADIGYNLNKLVRFVHFHNNPFMCVFDCIDNKSYNDDDN